MCLLRYIFITFWESNVPTFPRGISDETTTPNSFLKISLLPFLSGWRERGGNQRKLHSFSPIHTHTHTNTQTHLWSFSGLNSHLPSARMFPSSIPWGQSLGQEIFWSGSPFLSKTELQTGGAENYCICHVHRLTTRGGVNHSTPEFTTQVTLVPRGYFAMWGAVFNCHNWGKGKGTTCM